MPAIPVIPYQQGQAQQGQADAIAREEAQDRINNPHLWDTSLDDEMQKQVGELGKEVILKGAKDSSGRTLFQNLLESTKGTSQKGLKFLGDFIWGGAPQPGEAPRDMQGTQMVPDPQNPGQFIHPGALQVRERDSMF